MAINLNLYTPHKKQKQIHKYCADAKTFFIVVASGRQAGKTESAINQAISWAFSAPNQVIYWVSPSNAQTDSVYKKIINNFSSTESIIKHKKGVAGNTEVMFVNNSVIKFRSAQSEESLRGESVTHMICDESAFIKQSTFQEILLPMLTVRGKKCLLISTPKGRNFFHQMYLKGKIDPKYKSLTFTSADNPYSSPDVIEIARNNLPETLFAQEYLAQFVDSTAVFKNVSELSCIKMQKEPKKGEKYWCGIDIALVEDYTVLTFINEKGECVNYERFNKLTAPELKEKIASLLKKWKPRQTMIELNNQGLPIFQDLKEIYGVKKLRGFTTTEKSKGVIINNLINAFGSKEIKVCDCDYMRTELDAFSMKFSDTGKVKFMASSGFNDDIVMSLAICWHNYNRNKFSGDIIFI